jgi:outer membrane murein-binding lipoprotein Lpp
MKRTALAGLLISAAMLASPVLAADNNLCTSKLQELKSKVNSLPASTNHTTMEIKRLMSSAEASQAAGDDNKCVTEATQASALADQQRNQPTP